MNQPDLNYDWYVQDQNIDVVIVRILRAVWKKNLNRLLSFEFF